MADVEKALSQAESLDERSPISDGSSHNVDKEEDGKPQAGAMKHNGKDDVPVSNSESILVDWDGPKDPEFPQNLYVFVRSCDRYDYFSNSIHQYTPAQVHNHSDRGWIELDCDFFGLCLQRCNSTDF